MIIDTEHLTYSFADISQPEVLTLESHAVDFDDEEDVLYAINYLPRVIGAYVSLLEASEEAALRFLEPIPEITLEERTDDWLADKRKDIEKEISTLKRQGEELTAQKKDIEDEFFRRFTERNSQGTTTSDWSLTVKVDDAYPTISERNEFEEYMLKTGKIHLLQKRLSIKAIREELDLMTSEKATWIEELDENDWDDQSCIRALTWMSEDELYTLGASEEERKDAEAQLATKLAVLQTTNQLKQATEAALEQHYKVPGIDLEQKLTLYQRKR